MRWSVIALRITRARMTQRHLRQASALRFGMCAYAEHRACCSVAMATQSPVSHGAQRGSKAAPCIAATNWRSPLPARPYPPRGLGPCWGAPYANGWEAAAFR